MARTGTSGGVEGSTQAGTTCHAPHGSIACGDVVALLQLRLTRELRACVWPDGSPMVDLADAVLLEHLVPALTATVTSVLAERRSGYPVDVDRPAATAVAASIRREGSW